VSWLQIRWNELMAYSCPASLMLHSFQSKSVLILGQADLKLQRVCELPLSLMLRVILHLTIAGSFPIFLAFQT
jgi:hypothetical protein